jgi:transcriptional regulator with XRE-family HTH domain
MAASGSPTVRRRRLAAELCRLRGHRTGSEVSRAIGWSPTKISRAESGRESIPPPEVEKLLNYYSVKDPLRGRLLELAEDAKERGWWDDYEDVLTPQFLEFIGLEAEAVSSLQWQADAIPGLLQTEDYARQLIAAYHTVVPTVPPSVHERFLEARMLRQERLTREPVLHLSVILDEAVLLRRIGDRGLMRAQLERLTDAADLPNVDLRVLPLNREIALLAGTFVIMSFSPRTTQEAASVGDIVSTENLNTELYVEGETDTQLYRLFFEALTEASLPPPESQDLIVSTIERTWAHSS